MAQQGDTETVAGATVESKEDAERKRLLEPTFKVAGKAVTLRKRLPAGETCRRTTRWTRRVN
jgi:hypothetical protein